MPVQFLGMGATNDGSDMQYTLRLARAHEQTENTGSQRLVALAERGDRYRERGVLAAAS